MKKNRIPTVVGISVLSVTAVLGLTVGISGVPTNQAFAVAPDGIQAEITEKAKVQLDAGVTYDTITIDKPGVTLTGAADFKSNVKNIVVSAKDVTITGVNFTDGEGTALTLSGDVSNLTVSSNQFSGSYSHGIDSGNGTTILNKVTISGNNFGATTANDVDHNILLWGKGSDVTINGNNKFSSLVQVRGNRDSLLTNVTIDSNSFQLGAEGGAITSFFTDNLVVSNNTFTSARAEDFDQNGSRTPVSLGGGVKSTTLSGNTFNGRNAQAVKSVINKVPGSGVQDTDTNGTITLADGNAFNDLTRAAVWVVNDSLSKDAKVVLKAGNTFGKDDKGNTIVAVASDVPAYLNDNDIVDDRSDEVAPETDDNTDSEDTKAEDKPLSQPINNEKVSIPSAPNTGVKL